MAEAVLGVEAAVFQLIRFGIAVLLLHTVCSVYIGTPCYVICSLEKAYSCCMCCLMAVGGDVLFLVSDVEAGVGSAAPSA